MVFWVVFWRSGYPFVVLFISDDRIPDVGGNIEDPPGWKEEAAWVLR